MGSALLAVSVASGFVEPPLCFFEFSFGKEISPRLSQRQRFYGNVQHTHASHSAEAI